MCTFWAHNPTAPPQRRQNVQIHREAGLRSDYDSAASTVPVRINEKTFLCFPLGALNLFILQIWATGEFVPATARVHLVADAVTCWFLLVLGLAHVARQISAHLDDLQQHVMPTRGSRTSHRKLKQIGPFYRKNLHFFSSFRSQLGVVD